MRYQLALGVSIGMRPEEGLRGARCLLLWGRAGGRVWPSACAIGAPVPVRERKRAKTVEIIRRRIISARAMESLMIRKVQQRGGGGRGGEAAE